MFFSQLSILKKKSDTSNIVVDSFDCYINSLSINARDNISISRTANNLGIDFNVVKILFEECEQIGILKKKYVLKCPECGYVMKSFETLSQFEYQSCFCNRCEDEYDVDFSCIDVLYCFCENDDSFNEGQRKHIRYNNIDTSKTVAPISDGFNELLKHGVVTNQDLYSPTETDYKSLEEKYNNLFGDFNNTTEQGGALDNLIENIFQLCPYFKTTKKLKTDTNQIDVTIRNTVIPCNGILCYTGTIFYIECKNENETPSGSYWSKLGSILSTSHLKFGIVASIKPPPKTEELLANSAWQATKVLMLSLSSEDFKKLIFNKINLLELLECKVMNIVTRTNKALQELGLYKAE